MLQCLLPSRTERGGRAEEAEMDDGNGSDAADDASPAAAAATNGPAAEEIVEPPTAPMAHFDDDGADAARAPAKADSPRRAFRKNHRPKPGPDDMRSSGDRPPRRAAAVNNTAVQAAQRSMRSESP